MATPLSPSGAFGGTGRPGMELWESNTYVTASNPGWPGQNVYIGGGSGPSGSLPVTIIGGSGSSSGGDINISSSVPLVVTSSQSNPVWISGSVNVAGIELSASISATPVEAYPNALENIKFTRKAQRFDLVSDTANYVGYAILGAAEGSAIWTIKKLSFDVSGNLESIGWSGTGSIWNNRGSEVYT